MAFEAPVQHPGLHIREKVIPKTVSVKEAASLMGVGRPALSNLLNGNASLSPEMAAKIERTFGAAAAGLLAMQSAYEAAQAQTSEAAGSARTFVPPFLKAKANDIEAWADQHSSRSRLAVFLRMLVHSTGRDLTKVAFPGNDDSERPGWDGYVETTIGTPWIPLGASGWEFGTNRDPGPKANKDFRKSVRTLSKEERADITFVFVTPRRWVGKDQWQKDRRAEGEWKDVVVYDSSDLEQWLEQSIPAQAWFAGEQGKHFRGTRSLDQCWVSWNADCEPPFTCDVFSEAQITAGKAILDRLRTHPERTIKIASDSREEAFSFLNCLFSVGDEFTTNLRDRAIVFEEAGPLSEIASSSSNFLPIIADKAVEKELSELGIKIGGILIYPRNVIGTQADVVLEPLSSEAFRVALESMDLSGDEIDRLSRESGRSLTVLRRRLSKSHAIQHPPWSESSELAGWLVPFLLAGSWKSNSEFDQLALCELADVEHYEELEKRFNRLRVLEHSPVWAIGNYKGVVSTIDALYAVSNHITIFDIVRFFQVTRFVLSELDPALDLPEDQRWAAGMYGKTREVSAALREGLSEALVLLAVHGQSLLGVDTQGRADRLIRGLLEPADTRAFESHSRDLPLYAEASPEEFLRIIEKDLDKSQPAIVGLLRPASDPMFGTTPRVGLLWALENLAWSPDYISRVVDILAKLAAARLEDNLVHKPDFTLQSIFRAWMPQTGAPLEQRIALLERLAGSHRSVAWPICVDQFDTRSTIGHYNHKPRWRDFAFGYGEPTNEGRAPFVTRAVELALDWPEHNRKTLGDLIENIEGIHKDHQTTVWDIVDAWGETASEEDRAWLREKIRVHTMTRRATRRRTKGANYDAERARQSYEKLEPRDLVQKHAWLFREHWVEESIADLDVDIDLQERAERVEAERLAALAEIYRDDGLSGLRRIAFSGKAEFVVGHLSGVLVEDPGERVRFARSILSDGSVSTSAQHRSLLAGLLSRISVVAAFDLIGQLLQDESREDVIQILTLMPFNSDVWVAIRELGPGYEDRYWSLVKADWAKEKEDIDYAVRRLLGAGRSHAAFAVARFHLKSLDPHLIFRILERIPLSKEKDQFSRIDAYHIREALSILDRSKAFKIEQMASLEFVYLGLFRHEPGGIPNIERQIEKSPAFFAEAISYLYKRDDDIAAAEEPSDTARRAAENAYHLLKKLSVVPGHNDNGDLSAERLVAWVDEVRKLCTEAGRIDGCDYQIGELLSRAPADENGIWPCMPVRDVLDQVLTERMESGLTIGIYNSRGAHWRGEGGQQERALAEKYQGWARSQEYTHPRVAAALKKLADTYRRDADWQDDEAGIRKRLRY